MDSTEDMEWRGIAIAMSSLTLSLMQYLVREGVIEGEEADDIIDAAVLDIEQRHGARPKMQAAYNVAIARLGTIRTILQEAERIGGT